MEKCVFLSGAFASRGIKFSDLNNFYNFISDTSISALPDWEKEIIGKDVEVVTKNADSGYTADEVYSLYSALYKKAFEIFNLPDSADKLELFIVDVLPEPFSDRPWKAMCVDERLGSIHGVKQGVYLKDDFLVRGLLEIMLSHEIVHNIISAFAKKKDAPYTALLEEGVCDLLSYYIVLQAFPSLKTAISTNLIQNRFAAISDTIVRKRYYKMSRLVLHIASRIGIKTLIQSLQDNTDLLSIPLDEEQRANNDASLAVLFSMFSFADSSILLPIEEYAIFAFTADKTVSLVTEIANYMSLPNDKITLYLKKMHQEGLLTLDEDKVFNYNRGLLGSTYYFFD